MPRLPWSRSSKSERPSRDDTDIEKPTAEENTAKKASSSSADNGPKPAPWKALFFFTTKSHLTVLSIGIISAIIGGIAGPAQALLTGKAFGLFSTFASGGISHNDFLAKETHYVYYMIAIGGGSWVVHFVFFSSWLAFGELQAKSARDRLFHGMLHKEIEWYDMRKNGGVAALIPRLQAQIRDLQLATAQPLGAFIAIIANACFSFGLAMYYSWKLTLVIVSTVPLIVFLLGLLGSRIQPNITQQQSKLTEALKHISSALNSIDTVKCFNGQEIEVQKYTQRIKEAAIWYYRTVNINGQQAGISQFLASAMFVQAFYYGGTLVNSGEKSAGDVVTTFLSALGAFEAISAMISQLLVLEKGRTAGATLRAVMTQVESSSTGRDSQSSKRMIACRGDISFKNVYFSYPTRPHQMALRNVSMFIPGGSMTFVVGRSGSGKSTLGQLLMRFYPCISGEILLDDVPINSLDSKWLRNTITLVEQNSVLFKDTILKNVAFGRRNIDEVSRREVLQATQFALLQFMISEMPDGLDTLVGTGGTSLSGGQRQRVALARARIRDSPILLLDESTSALDHISRGLIVDAIKAWRKNKTTIIITHDISQIEPEDYVYILENGKLVQEGFRTHMEQIKDSPFQSFLPVEQRAQTSPYDERRHTLLEWATRKKSSMALPPRPQVVTDVDPIDAHLKAGENYRVSYLPKIMTGHGANGNFAANAFGGRFTRSATPWLSAGVGPETASDSPRSSFGKKSDCFKEEPDSKRQSKAFKRVVSVAPGELMDTFMDRTGALAAQIRLGNRGQRNGMTAMCDEKKTTVPDSSNQKTQERETLPLHAVLMTIWPNLGLLARVLLIVGFTLCAVHAAATPVFSFCLNRLIGTYGTGSSGKHKALIYALAIISIAIVDAICVYFMHILLEYCGQNWVDQIRSQAVSRILDQPKEFFGKEENSVSRLTESLDRHAEEMRNLLGRFLSLVLVALVMCTTALIWSMITEWKLTLIALALGPYIFCVTKAFSTVSGKWEGKSNDASEKASAIFTETFTSIKTVRALTLEDHFIEKYTQATRHALFIGMQRATYAGFFYGLSDSSGSFAEALIFYVGARIANSDASKVSSIVLVFLMLIMTITNIGHILGFIPQMSASRDTASRLLRLATLPQDSHEHDGSALISSVGDVEFANLDFSYSTNPNTTVLRNLSLHIRSGTSTAIVGASGSGKSTITALLLKLYSTSAASRSNHHKTQKPPLTISNRAITHIHTPTLRRLISIVSQTPTLFAATIGENIAYGLDPKSPYASLASVRAAAQAAGIDDFILSLPLGYATPAGEGGMGLSGGQAQRVAIARALVRNPDVLVLDEATSALDPESAALIRETVLGLLRGDEGGDGIGRSMKKTRRKKMTVLIVTHSREMMEIADRVVVMDQGRVVEEGVFGEMMRRDGPLSRLLSGGEWTGGDVQDQDEGVNVNGLERGVDWE